VTAGAGLSAWWSRRGLLVIGILVLIYLFIPMFIVAGISFNVPPGPNVYQFGSFTWNNWTQLCEPEGLCPALWQSIEIGALATLGSTILGTLLAFALVRHRFAGRSAVNLFLFVLPVAAPRDPHKGRRGPLPHVFVQPPAAQMMRHGDDAGTQALGHPGAERLVVLRIELDRVDVEDEHVRTLALAQRPTDLTAASSAPRAERVGDRLKIDKPVKADRPQNAGKPLRRTNDADEAAKKEAAAARVRQLIDKRGPMLDKLRESVLKNKKEGEK